MKWDKVNGMKLAKEYTKYQCKSDRTILLTYEKLYILKSE